MSPLFEPADGVQARWKKVYDLLKGMDVGDVLTYDTLAELFPELERQGLQGVVRRAAQEFLEENNRGLRNVRGLGYRVINPAEHIEVARWHQARSVQSLKRGQSAVAHVDLSGMSPEIRALTEATGRALTNQLAYMQRMDVRQKKLERVLSDTVDRTATNEDQIRELQERLDRLEKGDQGV